MKIRNNFRSSTEASWKSTGLKRILTSRSSLLLVLLASIVLIGVSITGPAGLITRKVSANTLCVNPAGSGGCFSSIQAAVTAANPGDTINVAAGTYTEAVTVNKQVFLRGANTGINACTGVRGAESIVQGPGGVTPFNVTANDVVIDGFTVQGTTNGNNLGFGIVLGAGTSGSQVLNNIVQNNIAGISLANNPSGNLAIIQGNSILNNNQPGPVSGTGIYTDQFNAGGSLAHVLIANNCFTTNSNVGVLLGPTSAAQGASNVTISSNTFTGGNGNAILLFNTTSSTVTQNTITGSTGSQVVIGGGVSGLQITENFIQNGATRGIRVGDFGGGSTNSSVSVNCNSISGNPTAGLQIEAAANSYTGTLDATKNWWGSATGPTIATNPGGTGDAIVDPNTQVVYTPFLTSGTDSSPGAAGFQCVCAPIPTGLVSWWRAENNANDSGGSSNNGTITGTVPFTPGKIGQAFNFGGAGCVSIPDNANLRPQAFTLDAYVRPVFSGRPVATADVDTIFEKFTNPNGYFLFIVQDSTFTFAGSGGPKPQGTIGFQLNINGTIVGVFSTTPVPNDGQFHLVAATYDGATASVYLDGALVGTLAAAGTVMHTLDPAEIGCLDGRNARAAIDEVEFFSSALSQTQIQSISAAGSTGKCPPPALTSAGATLVAESCSTPANGVLDPGETVTVSFCVQNTGGSNTATLMGTLQATGGVTNIQPPNPQNYGVVVAGGPPVCRSFTFTAAGTCGGTITASIQFQDGATNLGTVTYTFTLGVMGVCCTPPAACMITCPANITKSNDPNQCGAVVTYPAPTTTGTCGTVTCTPASGSFFPKGTTTVTCTPTTGSPCTFTVTVNDTQPPTITCPPNVTTAAQTSCPPATTSGPVNFTVTASDNCPGVTIVCKNQNNQVVTSGSPFPVGTTTVTCTATDASGNTATCSFTVTVFSACLVDQTNPGNVVLFNTSTGQYRYCCSGMLIASGTGVLTIRGCIGTIDDQKGDRKVHIGFDFSANNGNGAGTAFIALGGSSNTRCTITDQSMAGNTCTCDSGGPPAGGFTKEADGSTKSNR